MADLSEAAEATAHNFHSSSRRQSLGLVNRSKPDFELFHELSALHTHPAAQSKVRGHLDHILRMILILSSAELAERDRQCVEEIRRSWHAVILLIEEKPASCAGATD